MARSATAPGKKAGGTGKKGKVFMEDRVSTQHLTQRPEFSCVSCLSRHRLTS